MRFKQAVIEYASRYGVTEANICYRLNLHSISTVGANRTTVRARITATLLA